MLHQLRIATIMLVALTLLTGVVYPLVITGASQLLLPHQANGSLIKRDGKNVGSELIGQPFDDPKYFWSRPSATGPYPYNASASSGSNLAVSNPSQTELISQRVHKLREASPGNTAPVPADLVTASGSGLDPHISPAAAHLQIGRVARIRGMTEEAVRELVEQHTVNRQFGVLGEPCVSVLTLNLALDRTGAALPEAPK